MTGACGWSFPHRSPGRNSTSSNSPAEAPRGYGMRVMLDGSKKGAFLTLVDKDRVVGPTQIGNKIAHTMGRGAVRSANRIWSLSCRTRREGFRVGGGQGVERHGPRHRAQRDRLPRTGRLRLKMTGCDQGAGERVDAH